MENGGLGTVENSHIIAPVFLGTIFNWCLLGTLVCQIHIYLITYPNDTRRLKCLVAGIFLLELAQTAILTHYAWMMLVKGWGHPTFDFFFPWSSATVPITSGLISMIVQIFFAWRIYMLRVSTRYPKFIKCMSVLIVLIALLQGIIAIYGGCVFWVNRSFEKITELTSIVEVWLGGSLVCDILIAATMISILRDAGRDSPWNHTTLVINKLILHAIETGAATAVTAIIDLVLFELFKATNIHQAPALLLGKLYTNALMVSLNGRERRRNSIHKLQQQSAFDHIHTNSIFRSPSGLEADPSHELALQHQSHHHHHHHKEKSKSHGQIVIDVGDSLHVTDPHDIMFDQKLDNESIESPV